MLDRRKKDMPFKGKDRRKSPKVGNFHLPKGGKRYQFNGLIVHFDPECNIWYVRKSSGRNWNNMLFEITGIENEKVAINWAKEYLNNNQSE
jgi:hypothetical protein